MANVLVYPHTTLRKSSESVIGTETRVAQLPELIAEMTSAMLKEDGVGISAVQIGHLLRVYLIRGRLEEDTAGVHTIIGDPSGTDVIAFVDPTTPESEGEFAPIKEGCLSFPGVSVYVDRAPDVRFTSYVYPNHLDVPISVRATGLYAQAVQHEDDHLYGVLLVDYVSKFKLDSIKKKLSKAAKAKAVKTHARKIR